MTPTMHKDPLKRVGLTRQRVYDLTKDWQRDFSGKLPSEDAGEFMYAWLKKWGPCWPDEMRIMMHADPAHVAKEFNERNGAELIKHEFAYDGTNKRFYYEAAQ